MRLSTLALGILLVLILAGCGDSPATAPAQDTSPGGAPVATRTKVTGPSITFAPRRGGAGTVVNIKGANFKPGGTVVLRLGTPNPVGEAIGVAHVGADGRWASSATIPGTLPSGQPVRPDVQGDVQIVAMDEGNNTVASAPFAFSGPGQAAQTP